MHRFSNISEHLYSVTRQVYSVRYVVGPEEITQSDVAGLRGTRIVNTITSIPYTPATDLSFGGSAHRCVVYQHRWRLALD